MAEDAAGRVWLAGTVLSTGGDEEAFVAQLQADGKGLQSVTYLGGSGIDRARSLHITERGIWVAGYTESSDFPIRGSGLAVPLHGSGGWFCGTAVSRRGTAVVKLCGRPGSGWHLVSEWSRYQPVSGRRDRLATVGRNRGRASQGCGGCLLAVLQRGRDCMGVAAGGQWSRGGAVGFCHAHRHLGSREQQFHRPASQPGGVWGRHRGWLCGAVQPAGSASAPPVPGWPGSGAAESRFRQMPVGAWLVGWSHASPSADRDGLLARLNRTGVLQ